MSNVSWKLFLDDERFPITDDWVIARSSEEAMALVAENGCPVMIAFDHDLGGCDTSMRFIRWLTDQILDGAVTFPENFSFSVHSQNPVGVQNINGTMQSLLRHLKEDQNFNP